VQSVMCLPECVFQTTRERESDKTGMQYGSTTSFRDSNIGRLTLMGKILAGKLGVICPILKEKNELENAI